MLIQKVESFLGKHIEGFFNKNFSSEIRPAELIKVMHKEAFLKKKKINSEYFIPNTFMLSFSAADFHKITANQNLLQNQMMYSLLCYMLQKDFLLSEEIKIKFYSSPQVKEGSFHLCGSFTESPDNNIINGKCDDPTDQTKVFKRDAWVLPESTPSLAYSKLSVLIGPDENLVCCFGTERINLGRRESNEMALQDQSTSRLHAYILCENHRHILCDADSLNGTYINERKIDRQRLKIGDRIRIGNTVISYEVNEIAF